MTNSSPRDVGAPLLVGFDLDMTLIDSREGIAAVYHVVSAETGVWIDVDAVIQNLGPPLEDELMRWFPADRVPAVAERYRELYPKIAIEPTVALPGAVEAIGAVRAAGGSVLVVTGKYEPNARLHVEWLGLPVDDVVGNRWGEAKGEALRARGAAIYVGDQPSDMLGGRRAGAVCVGVATGGASSAQLYAAGADLVLADLSEFPARLAELSSAGFGGHTGAPRGGVA